MTVLFPHQSHAQDPSEDSTSAQIESYAQTARQLQTVLSVEKQNLEEIKKQAEAEIEIGEIHQTAMNAWRIQMTSYNSLLTLPEPRHTLLAQALGDLQSAMETVQGRIKDVAEKTAGYQNRQQETENQILSYQSNLEHLEKEASQSPYPPILRTELEALIQLMKSKKQYLGDLLDTYGRQTAELHGIRDEFSALIPKLTEKIEGMRSHILFTRRTFPSDFPTLALMLAEIQTLTHQIQPFFSHSFWTGGPESPWQVKGYLLTVAMILYGVTLLVLFRIKKKLTTWQKTVMWKDYPVSRIILRLFSQSLFLVGTALFVFTYSRLADLYFLFPAIGALINILLTLLGTRWFLLLVKIDTEAKPGYIPPEIARLLRILLYGIRYLVIAHILIGFLLPDQSVLLIMGRIAFEILVMIWLLLLFSAIRKYTHTQEFPTKIVPISYLPTIKTVMVAIPGIAVILEILGYGSLSLYWLASWGRSMLTLLWAGLFFLALRNWDQKFYTRQPSPVAKPAQPVKWLLFRCCWLAWSVGFVLDLIWAWGGKQAVISGLQHVLRYTVTIGDLKINLIRLFQAFFIIFITHMIVRIGRHLLQTKLLDQSGLEKGLRATIVTISVYLAWGLGILAALYAVGFSGTSLTVAFGALSIGLGFGLQNIFNNFMSGIIMLFERPIEVGDAIEINGIWGEVKRINFRSTVVKTYDNAALIIPNSDFISNLVTNWSFRDQRLRVKINIGVAYGSDIECVRKILLEVASANPHVLKYPQPDVHFMDFADSSLNFVLRVWTDIDHMLVVGTEIRFEIDRRFREAGVEIPFPQRDLHLRTVTEESPKEVATGMVPKPHTE